MTAYSSQNKLQLSSFRDSLGFVDFVMGPWRGSGLSKDRLNESLNTAYLVSFVATNYRAHYVPSLPEVIHQALNGNFVATNNYSTLPEVIHQAPNGNFVTTNYSPLRTLPEVPER